MCDIADSSVGTQAIDSCRGFMPGLVFRCEDLFRELATDGPVVVFVSVYGPPVAFRNG